MPGVNISLPSAMIEKVDKIALEDYKKRSEVIQESLRQYIERRTKAQQKSA